MPATLREVLKTNTFEEQRQIINTLAQDLVDVTSGSTSQNLSLSDGILPSPSLFFTNDTSLGLYRAGTYKMGLVSSNKLVASIGVDDYDPGEDIFNPATPVPSFNLYEGLNNYVTSTISSISINSPGKNYSVTGFTAIPQDNFGLVSLYENVPLVSDTGIGELATADIEITSLRGQITSAGQNYYPGIYNQIRLKNKSRKTAIANGFINNGGSAYITGTYNDIELIGGSGNGMVATIVVSSVGFDTAVTSVTITDPGSGYQAGDNLSALLGSGGGFVYTLSSYASAASGATADISVYGIPGTITNPGGGYGNETYTNVPLTNISSSGSGATANIETFLGEVSIVTIIDQGEGYKKGDVLSASNANLGGTGSGFRYTISEYGGVSSVTLLEYGEDYDLNDVLTLDIVDINGVDGTITNGGSGHVAGTYTNVPLQNGNGSEIVANITTSGPDLISGTISPSGSNYTQGTYTNVPVLPVPTQTFLLSFSNGQFIVDGNTAPALTFTRGNTYVFDISDVSLASNTLDIEDFTNNLPPSIVKITKGTFGSAGSLFYVIVKEDAPLSGSIVYYCPEVAGIAGGNTIQIVDGSFVSYGTNGLASVNVNSSGQISAFQFTDNGEDYFVGDLVTIHHSDVSSPGTATGFEYEITSISPNASVSSVSIIKGGEGYLVGDILTANNSDIGGSGSGFQYTLTKYNDGTGFEYTIDAVGSVTDITLTSGGYNYAPNNTLSFDTSLTNFTGTGSTFNVDSTGKQISFIVKQSGQTAGSSLKLSGNVSSDFTTEDLDGNTIRLVTDGKSAFRDSIFISKGNSQNLSIAVEENKKIGFYVSTSAGNDFFNIKTDGGSAVAYGKEKITYYKSSDSVLTQIDTFTITPGSGYEPGVYTNVPLLGGAGVNAIATLLIAFSGNILDGGTGYYSPIEDEEYIYDAVPVTGGSGSSAVARVKVINGEITEFTLVAGGSNYEIGDIVSVDQAEIVDPVTGGGGTGGDPF
jgi:hypothetical protein